MTFVSPKFGLGTEKKESIEPPTRTKPNAVTPTIVGMPSDSLYQP